jgi:hypothetical protein
MIEEVAEGSSGSSTLELWRRGQEGVTSIDVYILTSQGVLRVS